MTIRSEQVAISSNGFNAQQQDIKNAKSVEIDSATLATNGEGRASATLSVATDGKVGLQVITRDTNGVVQSNNINSELFTSIGKIPYTSLANSTANKVLKTDGSGVFVLEDETTVPNANEATAGVLEIATSGEAIAGTLNDKIMTPARVKQVVDAAVLETTETSFVFRQHTSGGISNIPFTVTVSSNNINYGDFEAFKTELFSHWEATGSKVIVVLQLSTTLTGSGDCYGGYIRNSFSPHRIYTDYDNNGTGVSIPDGTYKIAFWNVSLGSNVTDINIRTMAVESSVTVPGVTSAKGYIYFPTGFSKSKVDYFRGSWGSATNIGNNSSTTYTLVFAIPTNNPGFAIPTGTSGANDIISQGYNGSGETGKLLKLSSVSGKYINATEITVTI